MLPAPRPLHATCRARLSPNAARLLRPLRLCLCPLSVAFLPRAACTAEEPLLNKFLRQPQLLWAAVPPTLQAEVPLSYGRVTVRAMLGF